MPHTSGLSPIGETQATSQQKMRKKMPDDVELTSLSTKEASFSLGSTRSMADPGSLTYDSIFRNPGGQRGRARGTLARWVDSFRRDPHTRVTMPRTPEARNGRSIEGSSVDVEEGLSDRDHHDGHYFDLHAATVSTANPLLARELKGRHLQMIAIGGSIGMFQLDCSCQGTCVLIERKKEPASSSPQAKSSTSAGRLPCCWLTPLSARCCISRCKH